jgi:hypothetical protein
MIILIGLLAYALNAPGWFWLVYWTIIILKTLFIILD